MYHCSVKIISRSSGRSSVGSSAYRSGEKITNERDGITHDYTHKTGVVYTEIMLPQNAPKEFGERKVLWNQVEISEKRKDAQTAREVEVALPREFSREEQIEVLRNYVKKNFTDKGMCADVCIHDKNTGNPHAHIMLTTRNVDEQGFTSKNREWNDKQQLEAWREDWANQCNEMYKKKEINKRIDHRSYEDQHIKKIPTIHLGSTANAMEKRGVSTERGNINREIKLNNEQIEKLTREINNTILERAKVSREIKEGEKELEPKESLQKPVTYKMTSLDQEQSAKQMISYENDYAVLEDQKLKTMAELEQAKKSYEETNRKYINMQQHFDVIKEYKKNYEKLEAERENLGMFKFSQKKEIDRKLDEIAEYKEKEYRQVEKETGEKIRSLSKLQAKLDYQENKIGVAKSDINYLEDKLMQIRAEQKKLGEKYCQLEDKFNKAHIDSKEAMSKVREQYKKVDAEELRQVIKEMKKEKPAPIKHKAKNMDRER